VGFIFSVSKAPSGWSKDLDSLKHIRVGVTNIDRWREHESDIDICLAAKPRRSFFPDLDKISVLTGLPPNAVNTELNCAFLERR
jgi:hypothetical protein